MVLEKANKKILQIKKSPNLEVSNTKLGEKNANQTSKQEAEDTEIKKKKDKEIKNS